MNKFNLLLLSCAIGTACADINGPFLGGGIGFGMQSVDGPTSSNFGTSPYLHLQGGYQFADFIGVELGYSYFTQVPSNITGVGQVSTTVYDIAFTPGFTIPRTPVTIYSRLGIDSVSSNTNNSFYNQFFSNGQANFEWGLGVKYTLPFARAFVRFEYVNYGVSPINGANPNTVLPGALSINAAYVF